jgi:hypothetical protein
MEVPGKTMDVRHTIMTEILAVIVKHICIYGTQMARATLKKRETIRL